MAIRSTPRSGTRTLAAAVVLALLLAACGTADDEPTAEEPAAQPDAEEPDAEEPDAEEPGDAADAFEEMTLTYASFIDAGNPHSVAHMWWMDEVTERTGGAVQFDSVFDGALCDSGEITECVGDGRADIGFSTPLRNPAELPIANIVAVPFQSSNQEALVRTYNELYAETPELQAEYEAINAHVLYYGPVGLPLMVTTVPITSIDDLDGISLRGVGRVTAAVEELGVNPVSILEPEIYESVQRGVVDGLMWTLDGIITFRAYEVVDYGYDFTRYSGSYAAMHHIINLDLWNSMSPELQAVFDEVSAELVERIMTSFFDPADEEECSILVDALESFEELPDGDAFQAWADRNGEAQLQAWIETANESGFDGAEAFADAYVSKISEYEGQFEYGGPGGTCLAAAG